MLIDFSYYYKINACLKRHRKPDIYYHSELMSVDIQEVDRTDTKLIILNNEFYNSNNFVREYIDYNGELYTPLNRKHAYKPIEDDLKRIGQEVFQDDINIRFKGIDINSIKTFEDINQYSFYMESKNKIESLDVIRDYISDNKEYMKNSITDIMSNCISIDGELYEKTIGPIYKIYKDIPVKTLSEFNNSRSKKDFIFCNIEEPFFYNDNKKSIYFDYDNSELNQIDILEVAPKFHIPKYLTLFDKFYYHSKQFYKNTLILPIELLSSFVDNNVADGLGYQKENFHIFDMDFLTRNNEHLYGRLLFDQLFSFNNQLIKDNEENFNTYFNHLENTYDFGSELVFHIKTCKENGYLMDDFIKLMECLKENYSQLNTHKTEYSKNGYNLNIWYPSDKNFFHGFENLNYFVEKYLSDNNDNIFNTKKGNILLNENYDISLKNTLSLK